MTRCDTHMMSSIAHLKNKQTLIIAASIQQSLGKSLTGLGYFPFTRPIEEQI